MKKVYHLMSLSEDEVQINKHFTKRAAVINNRCQRCGFYLQKQYCENCCELSVIKKGDYLYQIENYEYNYDFHGIKEEVNLTFLQKECSDYLLNSANDNLVWAVCGAGKTEITFELITTHLKLNHHVCFAITRKDILYEIGERLNNYYVDIDLAIINGDTEKYVDAQVYVMTTNQLLRFKNAFSLIIIDEVDAFPFEYNPKFDFGVRTAAKKDCKIVYLTSTPSQTLLKKNLDTFIINRRWHDFDLPVPKICYYKFNLKYLPNNLIKCLKANSRQQVIFVANRCNCELISVLIRNRYKIDVKYVHSSSEMRKEIINDFRLKKFNILVCTTILERGVTFDDIDVHVLDADSKLYTKSALVQIAGRVGRKKEFQEGYVFFYCRVRTSCILSSIRQIKKMNKL